MNTTEQLEQIPGSFLGWFRWNRETGAGTWKVKPQFWGRVRTRRGMGQRAGELDRPTSQIICRIRPDERGTYTLTTAAAGPGSTRHRYYLTHAEACDAATRWLDRRLVAVVSKDA